MGAQDFFTSRSSKRMVILLTNAVLFLCVCALEAANAPWSRTVRLSIDKEGTGSLLRSDSTSSRKINNDVNDNLGDIPFYILNLDRRKADRFTAIQFLLGREAPWISKRACRVSAPDGQLWSSHVDASIIDGIAWEDAASRTGRKNKTNGGALTKGAVALMVGHAMLWEQIVRHGAPLAVVMEDDIVSIHPRAKEFLEKLRTDKQLQEGWDFLLFQSSHTRAKDFDNDVSIKFGHVFNTGMYVIKLEAAKSALRSVFPIGAGGKHALQMDHLDGPLWKTLRGAYTSPALADATHSFSDVQQLYFQDDSQSAINDISDCPALDPSRMIRPALLNPTSI